jgi:threonine dehydrogenase-like Zn-dependent dehydrogenase
MKVLCRHGTHDIRYDTVPDPMIEAPRDAIVKVSNCAICGSDLHLFDGFMPGMKSGDIVGHEFMGEVVEVGPGNTKLRLGDRLVVPFTIARGECEQCRRATTRRASAATATRTWRPRRSGTRRRGCSATRTSRAAMQEGRPSTCACHRRTWRLSKFPTNWPVSKS